MPLSEEARKYPACMFRGVAAAYSKIFEKTGYPGVFPRNSSFSFKQRRFLYELVDANLKHATDGTYYSKIVLTPRDLELLQLGIVEFRTIDELAKHFGCSRQNISRWRGTLYTRMAKALYNTDMWSDHLDASAKEKQNSIFTAGDVHYLISDSKPGCGIESVNNLDQIHILPSRL